MNVRWSLDDLYKGFDSKEFKEDLKGFEKAIASLCDWARNNLNSGDNAKVKLEEYITALNAIFQYEMIYTYCMLISAVDSENIEAVRYAEIYQDMETELVVPQTMFFTFVKNINNLDELVQESEILTEHAFFLKEVKAEAKYILSEKEEAVLSKMKTTGSIAWETLRDQLTSTLLCDIEIGGKQTQLPFTFIRNMAFDADIETRKKAYYAEIAALKKIEKSAAASLNAIKGEALTESKLRGYDSILHMTLENSRMERATLDAMFTAIDEYLPVFTQYFKRKAEFFGDTNGLKFYNLFAPVGEKNLTFTYEEAAEYVIKNFCTFTPELGDFAQYAFDNDWLDVEPREGKAGGAFCAGVHPIQQSRIMSNFSTGSFEEMLTLAHELGHGFHGHCLKKATGLNSDYPMPIAETASTFCETLICKAALKEAVPQTKLALLDNEISSAAQVIVDIYARYLFESEMIQKRANGSLSTAELSALMVESQKKAYGAGLDPETIHPYMWIVKGHYYSASRNFYNFPYAYGHLFSLGLYVKYLEEGDSFVAKYKDLLEATGKMSLKDVALLCDIDINDKAFWISSLKLIAEDIETYVNLKV